jgi:membrane protein DedA with SNARE-associated domain
MNEITQFLVAHGGPLLFAVVFLDQAGLPLPSAPWLLAAGALSASGKMNASVALGLSVVACLAADSIWFYVGRRGGARLLRLFGRLSQAPNSPVGLTEDSFARHALRGVVLAKFLPGLGTVMPPLAGALGMTAAHFLLFDGLGSFFYGTFCILAGFLLHNQLQQVLAALNHFGVLLLVLVLVPTYIALNYIRRRRKAQVPANRASALSSGRRRRQIIQRINLWKHE